MRQQKLTGVDLKDLRGRAFNFKIDRFVIGAIKWQTQEPLHLELKYRSRVLSSSSLSMLQQLKESLMKGKDYYS
jgi:hypothetical protein